MTPLDLAAIEKAAKEATEGPWVRSNFGTQVLTGDSWSTICVFWEHTGDRSKTHNDAHWQHGPGPASPEANATFIALANPATILALCARLREPAKVKPLVWREYPNAFHPDVFFRCWDAETPFGRYTIEEASASDSAYYKLSFGHIFIADKDGLPDAKAAAQQHFGDSIKGVLE